MLEFFNFNPESTSLGSSVAKEKCTWCQKPVQLSEKPNTGCPYYILEHFDLQSPALVPNIVRFARWLGGKTFFYKITQWRQKLKRASILKSFYYQLAVYLDKMRRHAITELMRGNFLGVMKIACINEDPHRHHTQELNGVPERFKKTSKWNFCLHMLETCIKNKLISYPGNFRNVIHIIFFRMLFLGLNSTPLCLNF